MTVEKRPFTVAMSVYKNDEPAHFDAALASVTTGQTVTPDEVLLVVDGPVPQGVEDVIRKYEALDVGLRTVRLSENGGLGNALRLAVERSSNELIARMDSDDLSVPDRFERELAMFEADPSLDVVGGDISEFIGCEDNVVSVRRVPHDSQEIRHRMVHRCAMNHVTVMYRRSAVLSAGNYIDWYCDEDYYLWLRMMRGGARFANTGTVLVNVRAGEGMYGRRGGMRYFKSEKGLQDYMIKNGIIGLPTYLMNVAVRFFVQVVVTDRLRGILYRMFARERA